MNSELRIKVLKAQGWRFEKRNYGDETWIVTPPNGNIDARLFSWVDTIEDLLARADYFRIPIPDPTVDKAAALDLLEEMCMLGWGVYLEGTHHWWVMLEEPGAEADALFSYVAEADTFCEAVCNVYLKAKEISEE